MISFQYNVYYEDTDAGGVVYYANYLKFYERARTDFLKRKDIMQSEFAKKGIFFVVKKCEIEYILPAKLEDILTVMSQIVQIGGSFITFNQNIYSQGALLNKATIQVICVQTNNDKFKPCKIPNEIKNILQSA